MQATPLTETHRALGAKLADFAGYEMPIVYTSLKEEHFAVRERAGIFDVSHMGEFLVRGPQALELVQHVTSNDVAALEIGQAQYSCLPNETGGIVDDLLVYRLPLNPQMSPAADQAAYMLVVNAANIQKDFSWIQQHNTFDAELIDISDRTGLLAVQGPLATGILQTLTDVDLSAIPYYRFARGPIAGFDNVILSATGYTGSGGFELYAAADQIVPLWNRILDAGKEQGILPAGLGARDTLRLEKGFALYGNDITDTTSPLEAGLNWITKLNKGTFVGSDWIRTQKEAGVTRRLVGFELDARRAPRHDYPIVDAEGSPIGIVTSGTHSPSLDKPIGMGYVPFGQHKVGTPVRVLAGKKVLEGQVMKTPFL
jgi:aminomethyltransferase